MRYSAYILGKAEIAAEISRNIGILDAFYIEDAQNIFSAKTEPHVVLLPCDFSNECNVRTVSRVLQRLTNQQTHKIVYAVNENLRLDHLLFCHELQAHQLIFGSEREKKLKDYLKNSVLEKKKVAGWKSRFQEYAQMLGSSDATKKAVYCLKQILMHNPQDFQVVNSIMQIYLKANQAELGMQVLAAHSDFGRYNILDMRREPVDSLAFLAQKHFSTTIYTFLTLRGAMAVKMGRFKDGYLHYSTVLRACPEGDAEEARVLYNMGISLLKQKKFREARDCLERSVRAGGERFQKAELPLQLLSNFRMQETKISGL